MQSAWNSCHKVPFRSRVQQDSKCLGCVWIIRTSKVSISEIPREFLEGVRLQGTYQHLTNLGQEEHFCGQFILSCFLKKLIEVPVRDIMLNYRLLAWLHVPLSHFLLQRADLFLTVPKSKVNISDGMEARKTISKWLLGKCQYFSLQIDCFLCLSLLSPMKKNPKIH